MRLAIAALASCLLFACGSSSAASLGRGSTIPVSAPKVTNVSGAVAASDAWSGTVNITADTVVNPGVTITVQPGTTINVGSQPALTIFIKGAFDIEGTSVEKVIVQPSVVNGRWNRFVVVAGGRLTARYMVMSGGGFNVVGGAVTLIDSAMSRSSGDLLEGSGSVDVEYSSIGLEPGNADTTHCDMHFNPGPNQLKVTHSNISTAVYGMMFYGGGGADFTYDNWFSNQINVETLAQFAVSGDFSHGWFSRGAPSGRGITLQNPSAARLPVGQAGPRP
ncbi:MAG: hypothetical protein ACHQ0J_00790 [Candidatus Dormibacterales bacterium]